MKEQRKRGIAIIAVLVGALLLPAWVFAGATAETAEKAAPAAKGDIAKYFPREGKKYTINYVHGASGTVAADAEMVQYWNKIFNVDLKVINIDQSKYVELLTLRFASGDIPDRFSVAPLSNLGKWVGQDLIAEIPEDVIKQVTPTLYKRFMAVDSNYLNYSKIGGKLYGLRRLKPVYKYTSVAAWRMDWLAKAGFTAVPSTLADAEKAFYAFRNNDPDGNGKKDTHAFSEDGIHVIYGAYGVQPGGKRDASPVWLDKGGRLVHSAVQPEMKEALATLARYYKDEVLDPEFVTGENKGGSWSLSTAFVQGRIGMSNRAYFPQWMPAPMKGGYQGLNITEMKKIYGEKTAEIIGYGGALKIPGKNSGINQEPLIMNQVIGFGKPLEKEPDKLGKILSMIEYIETDVGHVTTAYFGIEGKHYQMVNGVPASIGKYENIADLAAVGGHLAFLNIIFPEESFKTGDYGKDAFAEKYGLTKGGLVTKLMAPLASEGKYAAELDKLRDEMIVKIITGDKPIDYFDEFVAKWNKAGGEVITKEANDWYATVSK